MMYLGSIACPPPALDWAQIIAFAFPVGLAGMMFGVLLMALTQRHSQTCPGPCKVGVRDFIVTGVGIGASVTGACFAVWQEDWLAGMAWGCCFLWGAGWLIHDCRLYLVARRMEDEVDAPHEPNYDTGYGP